MKNISQVILLSTSCLIWYGADNVCASVNVFSGIPKSGTHNTLHTTPYLAYPHLPSAHPRGVAESSPRLVPSAESAMLTSFLPEESNHYIRVASVCFITDTGACSGEKFSNDETPGNGSGNPGGIPDYDTPQEQCQAAGYGVTSCPAGSHGDNPCPADSAYYQKCVCDANMTQTCTKPNYGVGPSCDGKYASCKRDDDKACKEEGYGQTASCSSVQTPNKKCSYNSGYYDKCVCRSDLVTCTYPQSGVGEACGGKYASCQCPGSYKSCECGGAAGATSCTVNGQTTYSDCKSCCNSSSSNWCWVHSTCHGDCCSDGTIDSCDERCGGSGCSSSGGSDSGSSGSGSGSGNSGSDSGVETRYGTLVWEVAASSSDCCAGSYTGPNGTGIFQGYTTFWDCDEYCEVDGVRHYVGVASRCVSTSNYRTQEACIAANNCYHDPYSIRRGSCSIN